MTYLEKAQADIVFATEMIRKEYDEKISQSAPQSELYSIVSTLEDVISDLEEFMRNEDSYNGRR